MATHDASTERSEASTAEALRQSTPGDRPPGPDGLPLAGNTVEFLRDPLAFYDRCRALDDDVVSYRVAWSDGYMFTHPDDIERVLVTDDADFRRASVIRNSLGQIADGGLFLMEGEAWQAHRSALQPSFYRERIETYADMMARFADERADEWEGRDTVTVSEEMRTLTLEILAKTLLDVDVRGRESAIRDAAAAISDRFDVGSVSSLLPLWVPTPANRRCRRAVKEFDDAIADIVTDRRASEGEFDDLLSILLDLDVNGEGLDESEIRDHLFTFLFAGHETTALTLSYAVFLLATHPEKQARLHEELDDVLGDGSAGSAADGPRPTAADLFDVEYLDRVVDEALRLYPPAYTVFREPTRDVEIGGYEIPAGSTISMPQWVVHRDERWYDDPDAFRPERWTDDFRDDLPEYAYFPFGGGPRHCIGMRFALMETKLVLATLAQRFAFEPVTEPPLDLSMQITLQPDDPIEVGVQERSGAPPV
ncbi:cytochrome P450 [Halosimplex aquaticum]|uniref:Cytochrome P450 n=1 Tax=Halosimplex aquaticum TaxID=3026162 RepID=A0ABD5XXP1_9EURY|nr:cytochrome P450 [Halosimplex aquaticum]